MMGNRTFPLAALLGLPPRKKSRAVARKKPIKTAVRPKTHRRGPRPVAAPIRKKFASRAEPRGLDRESRRPTFAELLGVDLPAQPHLQRQPAPSIVDIPALQSEPEPGPSTHNDGLPPRARRIIALGAAARGEAAPPDDIEVQLRRARDDPTSHCWHEAITTWLQSHWWCCLLRLKR